MKITALAGGIGGARYLRGVLAACPDASVTVIGNTGDDLTLFGLRICPDLDTMMYTLGGGANEEQGWGRAEETWAVKAELAAYGAEPTWFGLGDRDFATHILRTQLLHAGSTLSAATATLCRRWQPGVTLLPMSDDQVETHVVVEEPTGRRMLHFQEWWVRLGARVPAVEFVSVGSDNASPAPGVLEAVRDADLVLLPPSNPVVSIGAILSVPGIADALRTTKAPVIGSSPIIGDAPVRGMADACLTAIGVATTAAAVARHYGARSAGGLLDGWLVHDTDGAAVAEVEAAGIACRAVPLLMSDVPASAAMVREALLLSGLG